MKRLLTAILLLATLTAQADPNHSSTQCGSGDLAGVSFIKCAGYTDGNLLNTSGSSLSQVQSIFAGLGFSSASTTWTEKLSNLNGTNTIDFSTALNGTTIIGIHRGGAGKTDEGTAFYVVSGANVDTFQYKLAGSSDATIYSLPTISPVPESSTWFMMLAGLASVLWVAGRKSR